MRWRCFAPLALALALLHAPLVAANGVALASVDESPSASKTLAGRASASLLEEKQRSESEAVRDAVAADVPSRAGADSESEDTGFKSWSQLYQWAMNASAAAQASGGSDGDAGSADASLPAVGEGGGEGGAQKADAAPDVTEVAVGSDSHAEEARRAHLEMLAKMAEDLPEFEGEIVQLENAVKVLREHQSLDVASVENALETIAELCHSGDNGIDLHTIGGLAHVVRLLDGSAVAPPVQQAASKALSQCAMNNPPVAHAAVEELGAVAPLIASAAAEGAPAASRARALMALASLVDSATARKALDADPRHVEKVTKSVGIALRCEASGREEQRSVLRALALADGLVRASDGGVRWRERFEEAGISEVVGKIVVEGRHTEDAVLAAAELASILQI